jgi:F420 biosynthesis protein FbiB-like protein
MGINPGPNQLHDWIRSRRSVRRFTQQVVSQNILERILVTACQAPSAHNRQPWRFIVILSARDKERLAECMGAEFLNDLLKGGMEQAGARQQVERSRQRILEAPAAILLCADTSELDVYPDEKRSQGELTMAMQSVAMAGDTLLLAAHAEGLGGVWLCAPLFAQQAVRRAFALPDSWLPQGLILLGYPQLIPPERPRKPLSEVVRFLEPVE